MPLRIQPGKATPEAAIMDDSFSSRRAADSKHKNDTTDSIPEAARQAQGISWVAASHPTHAAASKSRAEEAYAAASVLLAGTRHLAPTSSDQVVLESRQSPETGYAKQAYDPIVWQLPESSRHVWEARVGVTRDPVLVADRQTAAQGKTLSQGAARPTPQIFWEGRIAKAAPQRPPGREDSRQDGRMPNRTRHNIGLRAGAGRSIGLPQAGPGAWVQEAGGVAGSSAEPASSIEVRSRASTLQLLQARMADRHAARRTLSSWNTTGVARGETAAGSNAPESAAAAANPTASVPDLPIPEGPAESRPFSKALWRGKAGKHVGLTRGLQPAPSSTGDERPAAGVVPEYNTCGTCGRSYHAAALEKHSRICLKVGSIRPIHACVAGFRAFDYCSDNGYEEKTSPGLILQVFATKRRVYNSAATRAHIDVAVVFDQGSMPAPRRSRLDQTALLLHCLQTRPG